MGILAWVLVAFGSIIVMILIFGFLSPRIAYMERSIEINSTKEKVYNEFLDYKSFVKNWSPWTDRDPSAEQRFEGPEKVVGSKYFWKGHPKKVGSGSMTISSVSPNEKVVNRLIFDGRGESDVTFYVKELDNGKVKVTWDFHSDNGYNPIARIFGRMMDKFLGPDYEEGLKKLKDYCEK